MAADAPARSSSRARSAPMCRVLPRLRRRMRVLRGLPQSEVPSGAAASKRLHGVPAESAAKQIAVMVISPEKPENP